MAYGINDLNTLTKNLLHKTSINLSNVFSVSHEHYPALVLLGMQKTLITTLERQFNLLTIGQQISNHLSKPFSFGIKRTLLVRQLFKILADYFVAQVNPLYNTSLPNIRLRTTQRAFMQ